MWCLPETNFKVGMANISVFHTFSMNNLLSLLYTTTQSSFWYHVHSYCTVSQTKFKQKETVSLGGVGNKQIQCKCLGTHIILELLIYYVFFPIKMSSDICVTYCKTIF